MLTRPLSWLVEKVDARNEAATIYDFAVDDKIMLDNAKNPAKEFCWREGAVVELRDSESEVNVHNASDNPNFKAVANSTVFRYDVLAAGEQFAGAIISEDAEQLSKLLPLLVDEIVLGGSHTAGYGCVEIEKVEGPREWQEYETDTERADGTIVTLLSDLIVRTPEGQANGDFDAALNVALGIEKLRHDRAYVKYRLVGGFNRQAGLPLAQEWAIQAGSVFVYPTGAFDPAQLKPLVERGMGERRAEGFGRIAVNWFTRRQLQRRELTKPKPKDNGADVVLSLTSARLAREMAQRRLRATLENALVAAVNGAKCRRAPENAQLSRVRSAAQQAMLTKNLSDLSNLLAGLSKNSKAQFERARIGEDSLLDWLKSRVETLDVAEQLRAHPATLPTVAGQSAELTRDLRVEYTARFIDGAMKKALKEKEVP
jgi:CRISPR-associated protein Csx10